MFANLRDRKLGEQGPMWKSLAGSCLSITDVRAESAARDLFHGIPHQTDNASTCEDAGGEPAVLEVRYLFAVQRLPWRLAIVFTDLSAPIVSVSWANTMTTAISASPIKAEVLGPDVSYGDLGLHRLLVPEGLEVVFPRPWPSELHIPGVALETEEAMAAVPELVRLGCNEYVATFDPDLGIVTKWISRFGNTTVTEITLNWTKALWS